MFHLGQNFGLFWSVYVIWPEYFFVFLFILFFLYSLFHLIVRTLSENGMLGRGRSPRFHGEIIHYHPFCWGKSPNLASDLADELRTWRTRENDKDVRGGSVKVFEGESGGRGTRKRISVKVSAPSSSSSFFSFLFSARLSLYLCTFGGLPEVL